MPVNGSIIQSSSNHSFVTVTEKFIVSCRSHQTFWPYYKHDIIMLGRFPVVIISVQCDYIHNSLLQSVIKMNISLLCFLPVPMSAPVTDLNILRVGGVTN